MPGVFSRRGINIDARTSFVVFSRNWINVEARASSVVFSRRGIHLPVPEVFSLRGIKI
jgi:hypothetical protein